VLSLLLLSLQSTKHSKAKKMNEGTKTGLFWLVSLLVAAIAIFVSMPRGTDETEMITINRPLFEDFTDPLAAADMKIVTFDDTLGQLESFEVAKDRQTGVWSIPSRSGYPADATDQMQKAATALLDLRILDVAAYNAEDHADFGVLEPVLDKLKLGDTGVGRLITIKDQDGGTLASLIIGKEVEQEPGKRYVRIPNQDPVYTVQLDDSALTTKFSEWIEEDLLQLNSFDIAGTKIRKYSGALTGGLGNLTVDQDRSYDANLVLDDQNQWQLESLIVYDESNAGSVKTLTADETLNTQNLNAMKNALDDLKIVDVVRKPDGMSADLKADRSLVTNAESFQSLIGRGFYPVGEGSDGNVDILAANGEMIVDLKSGVQYVLRFGSIAGLTEEQDAVDPENPEAAESGGANRYLLVTTRLNESMIPPPELKVVPQSYEELMEMQNPTPAEPVIQENPLANPAAESADPASEGDAPAEQPADQAADKPATDEKPADESNADQPADPQTEKSDDAPTPAGDPATPAQNPAAGDGNADATPVEPKPADAPAAGGEDTPAPGDGSGGSGSGGDGNDGDASGEGEALLSGVGEGVGAGMQPPAEQDPEQAPEQDPADAPQQPPAADQPANEPASEPESSTDEGDATSANDDQPAPLLAAPENAEQPATQDELTEEEKQEYLQAEQEKLIKENQRLREEWKGKLDEGKQKVRELNARFSDWYYIIPESTYRDLQIDLEALTQPKSAANPQGANQFNPGQGFPGGLNFGN
jgi:hypothetical protein